MVLDVIGGDYVDRNVKAIRVGGTIVLVGVMGGFKTTVTVGALLPKRATIIGTTLRIRPLEEKIAVTRRSPPRCCPCSRPGGCARSSTHGSPSTTSSGAHEHMEANANVGKIVVDVQP